MVRENMNRHCKGVLAAAVLMALAFAPCNGRAGAKDGKSGVAAARQVLERVLGSRAASFDLTLVSAGDSLDMFEVASNGGRVTVRGTSPVALVRGTYHYLRNTCHCMVTWSGSHLDLPEAFPDCPREIVRTPYQFRQYFNICAFGYTTAFWDWNRWEREIDWMALHGINMPLAMVGQVGAWQRVWGSFGIPRDSLRTYFVGPAFLPWHWMGNINRHEGPPPQKWIDDQELLQKKILSRMRELGMTPVVPAFSGFVPETFRSRFPQERVFEHLHWSSLPDSVRTFALVPGSPMFREIGERFIKEYRKTFGPCKYYLADSFNELDVPVSADHRYEELAGYGEAVYQSIQRGDPNGVWVMQGWLFNNAAAFWDSASTRALLSRVPDDRMMIIDLANEEFHGWKKHHGFYGKKWIYSIIHNFGGNNPLRGNLRLYASDPLTAVHDPNRGNLTGFGLSSEGVENNEVAYELLTDMGWKSDPVDLHTWLHDYCAARYGLVTPGVDRAWRLLDSAVYGGTKGHHVVFAYQHRPKPAPVSESYQDPRIDQALDLMLADADRYQASALFRNDLIDVAVYAIGNRIDQILMAACRAHADSNAARRDSLAQLADMALGWLDAIINVRPDERLERWIGMARSWGSTDAEQKLMERNARRQITVWGGPNLHEYASKIWGGMVRDYYAERWRLFFTLLRKGVSAQDIQDRLRVWDENWGSRNALSPPDAIGDVVKAIRLLSIATTCMVSDKL
jgi:alpha-N-acetylglucosaminidase